MYVHLHAYTPTHTHLHTNTPTHLHTCTPAHLHIHTYTPTHLQTNTTAHLHIYTSTRLHTHLHMDVLCGHAHTYIHTHSTYSKIREMHMYRFVSSRPPCMHVCSSYSFTGRRDRTTFSSRTTQAGRRSITKDDLPDAGKGRAEEERRGGTLAEGDSASSGVAQTEGA